MSREFNLSGNEYLVQHQVNNDASHGNVHPDSECIGRNRLLTRETSLQRSRKRYQDERHYHRREQRMRDQEGEVERTRNSLPLKMRNSRAKNQVVVKIENQEQARRYESRKHQPLVRSRVASFDAVETRSNEHGARAVQHSIERGKESRSHLNHTAGLLVRRLATRNDNRNIIRVNSARMNRLPRSERSVDAEAGNKSERSASVP